MTTETFTIDGTEYTWYNYTEPLEVLNAVDVNNAQANCETIKAILTAKGYNLAELSEETANYNTPLIKVIDVLNSIEYNLDVLNDTDVKSVYYGGSFRVVPNGHAHNTEQIWRWFQVLNDILPIAKGEVGKWGYLLCTDGYPTINGKRILIRGDLVG